MARKRITCTMVMRIVFDSIMRESYLASTPQVNRNISLASVHKKRFMCRPHSFEKEGRFRNGVWQTTVEDLRSALYQTTTINCTCMILLPVPHSISLRVVTLQDSSRVITEMNYSSRNFSMHAFDVTVLERLESIYNSLLISRARVSAIAKKHSP